MPKAPQFLGGMCVFQVNGDRSYHPVRSSKNLALSFTVANVPGDNKEIEAQGGLAAVLHAAVIDPSRYHLKILYNGPKPDLLRDEAQAIMTGKMGDDGVFHASELLLKCPTKYEEAIPSQVVGN